MIFLDTFASKYVPHPEYKNSVLSPTKYKSSIPSVSTVAENLYTPCLNLIILFPLTLTKLANKLDKLPELFSPNGVIL